MAEALLKLGNSIDVHIFLSQLGIGSKFIYTQKYCQHDYFDNEVETIDNIDQFIDKIKEYCVLKDYHYQDCGFNYDKSNNIIEVYNTYWVSGDNRITIFLYNTTDEERDLILEQLEKLRKQGRGDESE